MPAKTVRTNHIITVKQFAQELMPHWDENDWFRWPPDLFALTSIVLKTTGLYRYAVTIHPDKGARLTKPKDMSQEDLQAKAREWRAWLLGDRKRMPTFLRISRMRLFDEKYSFNLYREADFSLELCTEILWLHALADETCSGFGVLNSFPALRRRQILLFLAEFLLEVTGTLSRLPKHHGVVLPKMRVPQRGLTPRSFSHHVTFHQSEVNVCWRTIPWMNLDENTVHIMAVPLPYTITAQDFRPADTHRGEVREKPFRYFEFAPEEPFKVDAVINLLEQAHQQVHRVHVLVFPELALTRTDLKVLKEALETHLPPHQIPMVITGLRGDPGERKNSVMHSVYFARKWYDLGQDKHHRWKLDTRQIEQYALAGCLNVRSEWWEGIEIPPRRLSFLAPNAWLVFCPLICEDLAQLEPVSELIRGVGPTLVLAILLDGPQLTDRWSARYVGVLVDDPGSSILTVTSLGMALRSRARGKPENRTVALWKDQDTGWEPIALQERGRGAVLLTITADWKEEFTADARSDDGNASLFKLHGTQYLPTIEKTAKPPMSHDGSQPSTPEDVIELTIFSSFLDAIVDFPNNMTDELRHLVLKTHGHSTHEPRMPDKIVPLASIREKIYETLDGQWPPPGFHYAIRHLCHFMRPINAQLDPNSPEDAEQRRRRWEELVAKAAEGLDHDHKTLSLPIVSGHWPELPPNELLHLNILVYCSVLWGIHNRIHTWLRYLAQQDKPTHTSAYYDLLQKIEQVWITLRS